MKERIVWLMIMVMCLVGYAQAQKCIIIHNPSTSNGGGPVTELQALMETLFGVGEVVQVYSNDWQRCQVGAAQDALNAAELVIVTRRMSSSQFQTRSDRAGNPNRWWDLDTPVITLSGYPPRGNRWGFASSNTVSPYTSAALDVLIPAHPFLEDTTGYPAATSVTINTLPWRGDTSTGTLIDIAEVICDSPDGNNRPVLVKFPGSGVAGIKGAPRSDFVMFSIGADTTSGGMDKGQYKRQTADCDQIMLNIAYEIVDSLVKDPTFNPPPVAKAGPDQSVYDPEGLPVQLAGSASDDGPSDGVSLPGTPGGVVSSLWYQQSGPGTATFSDTGIMAPTVTFDLPGVYELVLQVSDIEPKDAADIVVITVKDHADDILVGHWPLDGSAVDASINSNDGTLEGLEGIPGGMPAYTWDAAVGSHSIDLTDYIGLNAINNFDPNLKYVDLGAATELDFGTTDWTVSGWVKTTHTGTGDINKGTIFGNGGDTGGGHRYCLIVSESGEGRAMLVTDDNSTKHTLQTAGGSSNLVNDGMWHFIVGVRDGDELRVYRDGILDTSKSISADYDLSGTSQANSYIGVITDWGTPTRIYKHLDGKADDVRVYNYAVPLEDPTYLDILELAVMGELPAEVDAGPDQALQLQPGESVTMAGTVVDNGIPGTLNIKWTTVSGPEDANAVFTDDTSLGSTVGFPVFGTYVLQVTVEDVNLGVITDTSTVTIDAISPTCDDVATEGLLLGGDISGPLGVPDCRVDLYDVAAFAEQFGRCNDPQGATCGDAWEGL